MVGETQVIGPIPGPLGAVEIQLLYTVDEHSRLFDLLITYFPDVLRQAAQQLRRQCGVRREMYNEVLLAFECAGHFTPRSRLSSLAIFMGSTSSPNPESTAAMM